MNFEKYGEQPTNDVAEFMLDTRLTSDATREKQLLVRVNQIQTSDSLFYQMTPRTWAPFIDLVYHELFELNSVKKDG